MEHLLKNLMANPQVALDLLTALKRLVETAGPDINAATDEELIAGIEDEDADDEVRLQLAAFIGARAAIAKAEANHITTKPLPEALAHEAAAVGVLFDHESLEQGE